MAKKKKISRKKQRNSGIKEKFARWWDSKNPILLFAVSFGLLMGIFYGFWFTEFFTENVLDPVVRVNAWLASIILNVFGYGVSAAGSDIYSSSFALRVSQGCDALEPMAIYLFAVLLFPVSFVLKIYGVIIGLPVLYVINQIRTISLYLVGYYGDIFFPDKADYVFDIIHIQLWPAVFIVLTLVALGYWILWALRKDKSRVDSSKV